MKYALLGASALAMAAASAQAGGVDRSGQSLDPIFEDGNYVELSFGSVNPSVSGSELPGLGQGGSGSDDMATGYLQLGLAYKRQITEDFSLSLIYDQPFGADVDYPTGTGYYAAGSNAELNSHAMSLIGRYMLNENVSVHGGVRYQTLAGKVEIDNFVGPAQVLNYEGDLEKDGAFGYSVGAAYEIPDIALRLALTYNSEITTDHESPENVNGAAVSSSTEITTPQSVNLTFQSGVAKDTLVFGGVRWVDWSEFDITPIGYQNATGASLVSYDDDTYSYTLGVGRRFSEAWAGSISVGYEEQQGGIASNLGPTDGYWSLGLGGAYTYEGVEISAGMRYVWIGDAETQNAVANPAAEFEDNNALGVGVKVGVTF